MEITKKQLLEMEINSMISSSESIQFTIHRVIGGWNYIYYDNDGDLKQVVFVPENKNKNTFQSEIKTGEPFHSDYIIDYKDKNNNYKSIHVKFNDEQHRLNWEKKWEGQYDNKIIGYHFANSKGEIIDFNISNINKKPTT